MRILMSNPLILGQTGAGRPYGQLWKYLSSEALKQRGHEAELISGVEAVKAVYGSTPPPESLEQGSMSDIILSVEKLMRNIPPQVFLGCGCASLMQMKEILHRFDGRTNLVTTWFSSHYNNALAVLEAEYRRLGINQQAIDPFLIWRDVWEHKYSDCLVVPSDACAETYEMDEVCRGKVRVANFGVDSRLFSPAAERPKDFRLLFAGGNWIRKGLIYLIQAWNELALPGVLTVIGAQEPPIKTWRAAYLGWVPDEQVPDYYRKASVFCTPTLEEGQALVVLEAMASGLPVITTRESGVPIEDGKEGLVVPARDAQKLKEATRYFYDNPSEIDKMGRNARAKAETLTWEKFGSRVVDICEEFRPK